jgi:hypothetical protein
MSDRSKFILIGVAVAAVALAFVYVGGWLTPQRLAPGISPQSRQGPVRHGFF